MGSPHDHRHGARRRPARRRGFLGIVTTLMLLGPASAQEDASVFIPRYDEPTTAQSLATDRRLIRFMTTDDFVPLNFRGATGETTGFNVALARAICGVLNTACSMQVVPWEQLEFRLLASGGDVAIAGHRISGREDTLIETQPYLANPARFVAAKGADGATWKTVGVISGSAHELYLKAFAPDMTLQGFETAGEMWTALEAADIDAIFTDALSASARLASEAGACCAFAPGAYTETRYFGEGLTMLLRAEDARLARAIEAALTQVIEDGTFAELYLRYFPLGLY